MKATILLSIIVLLVSCTKDPITPTDDLKELDIKKLISFVGADYQNALINAPGDSVKEQVYSGTKLMDKIIKGSAYTFSVRYTFNQSDKVDNISIMLIDKYITIKDADFVYYYSYNIRDNIGEGVYYFTDIDGRLSLPSENLESYWDKARSYTQAITNFDLKWTYNQRSIQLLNFGIASLYIH